MKLLTKDQIILLHKQLINQTGGSNGIRDDAAREEQQHKQDTFQSRHRLSSSR